MITFGGPGARRPYKCLLCISISVAYPMLAFSRDNKLFSATYSSLATRSCDCECAKWAFRRSRWDGRSENTDAAQPTITDFSAHLVPMIDVFIRRLHGPVARESGGKMIRRRALALCTMALLTMLLFACSRDPNVRKQKYLESGQRYFAKAAYRAASIQFRNAVQVDPNFAAARYELARTYLHLQDWNSAYRELNRTIDLQPQNYEARMELAKLLIRSGQLKPAEEQLDDLTLHQPDNPDVHLTKGSLLAAQQELPEAIQELQKSISLDEHRGDIYLQLALLQLKNNEVGTAELSFKRAIAVTPQPSLPEMALGAFYQSQRRFPEAEKQFRGAIDVDPKNPDCRISLARLYLSEDNSAGAEDFLRKSKTDFPDNPIGYRMLGDLYFAMGEFDKATAEYSSLHREHPDDPQVTTNYVQLLIINNRLDEAGRLDEEVLKAKSDDVDALIERGQIQIATGRLSDAISTLQNVIKNNPDNGLGYYHLGVAFERLKNPEQGEKAWQEAVRLRPDLVNAQRALAFVAMRKGDMPELERLSTQIVDLQPTSAEGYSLRALAHIRRGQLSQAEPDVQKAISVAPHSVSGYLQLGNLHLAKRNFREAERAYQQALQCDARSSDALAGLMGVHFAEGKPASAFAAARVQIAKVPGSSAFHDMLGTVLFDHKRDKRDIAESESNLTESVELDEHNVDAWLKLIQVQAVGSSSDQAVSTGRRAIEKNPDESGLYVLLGELYVSRRQWQEATAALEKALSLSPQNPAASNDLASLMLQTGGNPDLAMPLAETARRGLPDSPQVADTMGWALYQKGAYESAIDQFQEALKLAERAKSPDSATVHFHLGLAYEKVGEPGLARQHLERVLRINPAYSRVEDVKKMLAELKG